MGQPNPPHCQVLHGKRKVLDAPTWSHLLRILLGVADRLLVPAHGSKDNGLGDRLQLELAHLVVGECRCTAVAAAICRAWPYGRIADVS